MEAIHLHGTIVPNTQANKSQVCLRSGSGTLKAAGPPQKPAQPGRSVCCAAAARLARFPRLRAARDRRPGGINNDYHSPGFSSTFFADSDRRRDNCSPAFYSQRVTSGAFRVNRQSNYSTGPGYGQAFPPIETQILLGLLAALEGRRGDPARAPRRTSMNAAACRRELL